MFGMRKGFCDLTFIPNPITPRSIHPKEVSSGLMSSESQLMPMGPAIIFRGKHQKFFECSGKIKFIPEPAFPGDAFDGFFTLDQHGGSFVEPLVQQKTVRRFAVALPENTDEMLQRNIQFFRFNGKIPIPFGFDHEFLRDLIQIIQIKTLFPTLIFQTFQQKQHEFIFGDCEFILFFVSDCGGLPCLRRGGHD